MPDNQSLSHQFLDILTEEHNFRRVLVDLIVSYGYDWAEARSPTEADEDGRRRVQPRWPGYREFFKDIEIQDLFNTVVEKASPKIKILYKQVGRDLSRNPITLKYVEKIVSEQKARAIFEEAVRERWSVLADEADYADDTYAYHGVSRRDFMSSSPSSPLRQDVLRLAQERPEMRKHLVPILRKRKE